MIVCTTDLNAMVSATATYRVTRRLLASLLVRRSAKIASSTLIGLSANHTSCSALRNATMGVPLNPLYLSWKPQNDFDTDVIAEENLSII